ncbi:MAG: mechanosensitive ion channel family protein [Planctomycetota bacterium]
MHLPLGHLALLDDPSQQALVRVPAVVVAGAIFVLFAGLGWIVRRLVTRRLAEAGVEPATRATVGRAILYPLVLLGVVLALGEIDVTFASLGVELGLFGVGFAFALKDILTNLASGLLLAASRPFSPGDQIRVKEYEGTVESVGWRGTFLKTYDGRRVIIPNQEVLTSPVTNNTAFPVRRSSIVLGVGLRVDLARAAQVARQALASVPEVAPEPSPDVLVKVVGDFSVTLEIRIWSPALQSEVLRVSSDATRAVKEAFDREGIEMPFPTQVVHVNADLPRSA